MATGKAEVMEAGEKDTSPSAPARYLGDYEGGKEALCYLKREICPVR